MVTGAPLSTDVLEGRCLCGAVTVRVGRHKAGVGACHCSRCRRWTGSALFAFETDVLSYEGPVKTWGHEIAERAFCGTCGTLLWLKDFDGPWEPQVGLFDGAKEYPLVSEIYTDRAFAAVSLAGDHARKTAEEYEAGARHVEPAPIS
jgi:hypothetical protein